MSSEKANKLAQLQKDLAESISKNMNIPVIVINNEVIDAVVEIAKKIPDIEKKYTSDELRKEISEFVGGCTVSRPKNKDEGEEKIKTFLTSLEKEKNYIATIILPNIIGLPIGTRIGELEIIEKPNNDELLEKHLEFLNNANHSNLDRNSYGRIEFKSYTSIKTREVLYNKLELPFSILSLITNSDCNVRDCAGLIRSSDISKVMFLKPQNEILGWSRYHAKSQAEYLRALSDISLDTKPNRLRSKVLQSLQIFGLSRLSRKAEIRFLLLISSFESLLLTENDRDYLGLKLAEKVSFLLKGEYQERKDLYKQMKKFYNKRSALIHRGELQIHEYDSKKLENIYKSVVFKILELSQTYTKMEQKSHKNDREGLEDYIDKLRFSS